jgi:tryptophan-rich sensory protein
MIKLNPWLVLAGFIILCVGVGGVGSLVTAESVATWYETLIKPSWNPPNWLFGPVWTTLYVMMAVAAWLVWRKGQEGQSVGTAMILFFVQLALNSAWSFIFFGARSPGWALVDIVFMLIAILLTTWAFSRHSKWAAILMLPYIAWVSFATVLNYAIVQLN